MTPKRIQLRRTKGWRKPDGAVVVARPSKWGNPNTVSPSDSPRLPWMVDGRNYMGLHARKEDALADAVELFRDDLEEVACHLSDEAFAAWLAPLRGKDLACWCPLDQPCHADVLLELANMEETP